jgi:hypothetical protein
MEHIHMYKKRGRHDKDTESTNNEEQLRTQLFNFMRKHPDIVINQVFVPQINLDIGTTSLQAVPILSSAGSAPDHQSTMWMTSMNPPHAHYSMSKAGR